MLLVKLKIHPANDDPFEKALADRNGVVSDGGNCVVMVAVKYQDTCVHSPAKVCSGSVLLPWVRTGQAVPGRQKWICWQERDPVCSDAFVRQKDMTNVNAVHPTVEQSTPVPVTGSVLGIRSAGVGVCHGRRRSYTYCNEEDYCTWPEFEIIYV